MSLPEPYYDQDGVTIYHADCRDVLPWLSTAALVLTDPPYGIGDRWTKTAMVGRRGSSRLWGKGETWDNAAPDAITIAAVVAAGTASIVWGGNYMPGLPATRGWLVWDKMQRFTGADAELAWTNLPIPTRTFRLSRIDAFVNQSGEPKYHPTEKPLQLMRWCLDLWGGQGVVLDPFMGSGTTLRAARDAGHPAIGIEIEEKYCEIAVKRLAQGVLDFGGVA